MNDEYFKTRFRENKNRNILWITLCSRFFNKYVGNNDSVLELGVGYGDFINNIRGKEKFAIDLWDGSKAHLDGNVKFRQGDILDIKFLKKGSIDFVFASNLFEHVEKAKFGQFLEKIKPYLKDGGTVNIVQPNFKYCYREYFDDYTHVSIFTDKSMSDFLESHGYSVIECRPKFLPFSLKSKLPVIPILIAAYLISPIKPMAKQMFIRAEYRRKKYAR